MTTRTDIIQHFIDQRKFKNYLEIGCFRNENFNKIKIDNKVSVDPDPEAHATYQMTSDEFFTNNKDTFDSSDGAVSTIEVDMNTLDYQDYLNLLQLNLYGVEPWSEVSKWHYEEF